MHLGNDQSSWLTFAAGIGLVAVVAISLIQYAGGTGVVVNRSGQAMVLAEDAARRVRDAVSSRSARALTWIGVSLVWKPAPAPPAPTEPEREVARASRPAPPVSTAINPSEDEPKGERGPVEVVEVPLPELETAGAVAAESPSAELMPLLPEEPVVPRVPDPGFGGQVFTQADLDVAPPRPLQPLLPANPPRNTTADRLGMAEYVVDHLGRVESVRLLRQSRFEDAMMPAVIKGWRFEPATKDGQRVKYRQTILLTQ